MMKINFLLFLYFFYVAAGYSKQPNSQDSLRVKELNALAFKLRLTDPTKTVSTGKAALSLAKKINFELGMAEAYRVIGIGKATLDESDTAIANYLLALTLFKKHRNFLGEARVYNNIGNRYKYYDYARALIYYNQCLKIAQKHSFEELIAGCYINMSSIYTRQGKYKLAMAILDTSQKYFERENNLVGLTMVITTKGSIYWRLNKLDEAKTLFTQAKKIAQRNNFHASVASIDMSMASIYITAREYNQAESLLNEGLKIARKVQDQKLEKDFLHTYYQLEFARNNYKNALTYLREIYVKDSVLYNEMESKKFTLHQEQYEFLRKQKETEILLERQKTDRVIFWATLVVLILSLAVIIQLILNSKKKAITLKQLQALNQKISVQKENLDQINQNLEEIIKERTADLQVKNLKLSQYSSHLSHEIRSPISTIKGLLILEQEALIEDKEVINEVRRCVEEIDNKLLNINHMLHNPQYKAFLMPENRDDGSNILPSSD